jgi:hypothetical protein
MKRIAALLILLAAPAVFGKTTITIINNDAANTGFNDKTPAEPVGGNPGTTLGEQRLNAFKYAAEVWGTLIDSKVEILVTATFAPINRGSDSCSILGQAGPTLYVSDFEGAPKSKVWYPIALANAIAGKDLQPDSPDIQAQFNSLIDSAQCSDFKWYYGLDGNHGNKVDLAVVLLHELAHGLGITGTTTLSSGAELRQLPSIHEYHTLDLTTGLRWDQMTAEQRKASALNTGRLVWDGASTYTSANGILGRVTTLTILAPSEIARNYDIGTAAFGPDASHAALTGVVAAASDESNTDGPTTTDGCTAYTNAGAIAGNIALVDRGTCTFVKKAQNAQAAGATGLVVVDNRRETCLPPGMAGDDTSITIPIVSISADDGAAIKKELANGVRAMLRVDPAFMAGASAGGHVRLYAPCTLEQGSSVFHWDVTAFPNLLMEPAINGDLPHTVDITVNQLIDMGWPRLPSSGPPNGRKILKRGH